MAQRNLRVVTDRLPVAVPFVIRGGVVWPWSLSATERRADKDACTPGILNVEHLDRVLEAKNALTGVTRRKRR